jgi:hypothetical protein
MRRMARSRDECLDLLFPRPVRWTSLSWTTLGSGERPVVDPAAQIRELVSLVDRGLLTGEAFERQRRKVLGP